LWLIRTPPFSPGSVALHGWRVLVRHISKGDRLLEQCRSSCRKKLYQ